MDPVILFIFCELLKGVGMPSGCSCLKVFKTVRSVENLTGQRPQSEVREWSVNYQWSCELDSKVIFLKGKVAEQEGYCYPVALYSCSCKDVKPKQLPHRW